MAMSQTLVSDMARKSLDPFLERAERRGEVSPEEARELLASCEIPAFVLERLWHLAQSYLDRGMERKQLAFLLKEYVEIHELGIKAFDAARDKVKVAGLAPEEKAEGLSMLERAGQEAAARRDELSSLLRRLETLRREVAQESLPKGRGDQKAEGYVSLDDVTARLLSGGDK
jgi:hypothetical protein